jgi:hypothetical protein
MNEFLIKNYITKLTTNEIDTFAKKNGIELNDKELKIIEKHIKESWRTIIYGNPRPILDNLKEQLDITQYQKIEKLYTDFKYKYKNYL